MLRLRHAAPGTASYLFKIEFYSTWKRALVVCFLVLHLIPGHWRWREKVGLWMTWFFLLVSVCVFYSSNLKLSDKIAALCTSCSDLPEYGESILFYLPVDLKVMQESPRIVGSMWADGFLLCNDCNFLCCVAERLSSGSRTTSKTGRYSSIGLYSTLWT